MSNPDKLSALMRLREKTARQERLEHADIFDALSSDGLIALDSLSFLSATEGSIDAALRLHEWLVPEYDWIISHDNGGLSARVQVGPAVAVYFGEEENGQTFMSAGRAWALGVLDVLIERAGGAV